MEVRKIETITKGADNPLGNRVRVRVVKNKVAPPFQKVELEIIFGKGISAAGSLLDAAVANGIIDKSGTWYSYGEDRIGQGRENARRFLEEKHDVREAIDERVRTLLFGNGSNAAADD